MCIYIFPAHLPFGRAAVHIATLAILTTHTNYCRLRCCLVRRAPCRLARLCLGEGGGLWMLLAIGNRDVSSSFSSSSSSSSVCCPVSVVAVHALGVAEAMRVRKHSLLRMCSLYIECDLYRSSA